MQLGYEKIPFIYKITQLVKKKLFIIRAKYKYLIEINGVKKKQLIETSTAFNLYVYCMPDSRSGLFHPNNAYTTFLLVIQWLQLNHPVSETSVKLNQAFFEFLLP